MRTIDNFSHKNRFGSPEASGESNLFFYFGNFVEDGMLLYTGISNTSFSPVRP